MSNEDFLSLPQQGPLLSKFSYVIIIPTPLLPREEGPTTVATETQTRMTQVWHLFPSLPSKCEALSSNPRTSPPTQN
jgi:hypothetical protein